MIITQTPLRISLAGGGTDFRDFYTKEGGAVVSTTIDKYVYVIVKERFDDKIYINYSRKEIVDSVEEIKHGIVREAMKKTGVEKGVEITVLADVPSEGSGLGSSSSFTVGLLNALYAHKGIFVGAEQLAAEACGIEIDALMAPIGVQDQYIAAYGGLRFFEFSKDGRVNSERLDINANEKMRLYSSLLLFFTNITRSASTVLSEQKNNIPEKVKGLKRIRDFAYMTRDCIKKGYFDDVGKLLHEGWIEKKRLASNISAPGIDKDYEKARGAGATGGKLAGAGGGGFLLLYCPLEQQNSLKRALNAMRELPFMGEKDGSKVIFNMGRYEWK